MADLLGATNPVPNFDNTGYNRSVPAAAHTPSSNVQNIADPTRNNRADGRTEQQGADNPLQSGALRYDSNLQVFLQQLRDAPDLAALLAKTVVLLRGEKSPSRPGSEAIDSLRAAAMFLSRQLEV